VRLKPTTDGRSHAGLSGVAADDHHSQPRTVEVNNTSQVLTAGSTYNLDIALGVSDLAFVHVILLGPRTVGTGQWKECADVYATRTSSQAMGHSIRWDGVTLAKTYFATYSKANGDARLTDRIFCLTTSAISLQDAVLTGSNLRLTFVNNLSGSATLWVKGRAVLG